MYPPNEIDDASHASKVAELISKSNKEFVNEYREYDENKCKEIYCLVLHEVHEAFLSNKVKYLLELGDLIELINGLESRETLKYYFENTENHFRESNVIILACKYGRDEVISCLFSDEGKISKNIFVYTGIESLNPSSIDGECHNCFYYAIRSNSTRLLNALINNWPGDYFNSHSEDLDHFISKAYGELMLKNMPLSVEMKCFVEDKLVDLRFFFDGPPKDDIVPSPLENLEVRFDLVLKCIKTLKEDYSRNNKVDTKFMSMVTFIALNIHILKQQLKCTYDKIPWEEMEFCLVSFVSSRTTKKEINLYFHHVLKKEKLLRQLGCFSECLQREMGIVRNADVKKLRKSVSLQRKVVIDKISSEFAGLYEDYELIRDVHSLEKMKTYIDLAVSADCWKEEEQLIISRALQVIGENLKNTLESPKLSNATSEFLLRSVTRNTRDIIKDLRDSLSHADSLLKRTGIDGEFFTNIQSDVKKLGSEICMVLYNNKMSIVKTFLEKFVKIDGLDPVNEMMEVFQYIDFEELDLNELVQMRVDFVEEVIEQLSDAIGEKTFHEKELFNKVEELIVLKKKNRLGIRTDCDNGNALLKSVSEKINNNAADICVQSYKIEAMIALKNIYSRVDSESDVKIGLLIKDIFDSARPRMNNDKLDEITVLMLRCTKILILKTENTKWIEIFGEKLGKNKYEKKGQNVGEDKFLPILRQKFSLLKNILEDNCLNAQNIPSGISNKKLLVALEMLILDIMSILDSSKTLLAHNAMFLDGHFPLLVGKCLRNHLAHGNSLMEVLPSDPTIALISNALKLGSENLIEKNIKIGKLVAEDPLGLENRMNQDLEVILNQEGMFSALEEGNYKKMLTCMLKGADIKARSNNLWNSFHFSAKGQSVEIVKFILGQNLDVNAKDVNGQSPLHIAAHFGRTCIAQLIIQERKIDFNERNNFGKTPLDVAAQNGHKDLVEILLKHTSETSNLNVLIHGSPLFHAVNNNRLDVAVLLLEREKNVDAVHCGGDKTLLFVAVEGGYLELVNYLLKRNADPNSRNVDYKTPLHLAARNGHFCVVKTLCSHGADVNAKCYLGSSPLFYAAEYGHKNIVKNLLENGANVNISDDMYQTTPLHVAALYGFEGIVEILLLYKANANSETVKGVTPVHFAARNGHKVIVELLLKHGVNVNARDSNGQTALHISSSYKHKDIVSILLKNGARINAKDEKGRNSLHSASKSGCKEVVEILTSEGAEINAKDVDGQTPLHISAFDGHKDVLEVLLEKGALIDAKDEDGSTPLHLAVQVKGNETSVQYLLSKGADVNITDLKGLTAMHKASGFGISEVIGMLCDAGADMNMVGQNHFAPLHFAVKGNHIETVKALISVKDINVDCGRKINWTPLCAAVIENYEEIVRILISVGADVNVGKPLHKAVLAGYKKIVDMLLKHKSIDISICEAGYTLLHLAAVRGRTSIIKALVAKGMEVDPIGTENETPLYLAVYEGHKEAAEFLLQKVENVNLKSNNVAAIHTAAQRGYNGIVEVLLQHGADVNILDSSNRTPIQLAVVHNHMKVVETLMCHKETNIQVKDEKCRSLLHLAANEGHLDMVNLLFDKGVDSTWKDIKGSKSIHIAAMKGYIDIVQFFLDNGIDINDRGAEGGTLLHYAAQGDSVEVANYLMGLNFDVEAVDKNSRTSMHHASLNGNINILTCLLSKGAIYNATDDKNRKPLDLAKDSDVLMLLLSTEKLFAAVKENNPSEVESCIKEGAFIDAKSAENLMVLHHAAWKGYENIVNILLKNKANPNVIGKNRCTPLHYAAKFGHLGIVMTLLLNGATYNVASVCCKSPADFAVDKDIINLLKLVDSAFKGVKNGSLDFAVDLKQVKDVEKMRAIVNCRNLDGRSLVACAMHNNFAEIQMLKQILLGDESKEISFAQLLMVEFEDFEESYKRYECVLHRMKDSYGLDNPLTLEIQFKMAKVLYKKNDFEGALWNAREIYGKQKIVLGANKRDTLCSRRFIALILKRQEKFKEALSILDEVYSIQKENVGECDSDTLSTQFHIAQSLESLGEHQEALKINVELYEKFKASLGSYNFKTLAAENSIAAVHYNTSDNIAYKQVYRAKKVLLDKRYSETLKKLNYLSKLIFKHGEVDECMVEYHNIYAKQLKFLGKDDLLSLNTKVIIGNVLFFQCKWMDALNVYKKVLERRREILGLNHPSVKLAEEKIAIINFELQNVSANEMEVLELIEDENNAASDEDEVHPPTQDNDCDLQVIEATISN